MAETTVDFFEEDSGSRFADIQVLLIDDDEVDLLKIKYLLSQSKKSTYSFTIATSIDVGIDYLNERIFDIVLLDYYVGSDYAWRFLEALGDTVNTIPVILVTGNDDDEMDDQLAFQGVTDCLSKDDLDLKMLERAIRYALHAQRQKDQLEQLAHFDSLTGLVNRSLFFDRLGQALARVERKEEAAALFYLDVDYFKSINDTYGHDVGDTLLITIASRLIAIVRKTDTVARLGGDEFSLLLEGLTFPEAHMIAQKLLYAMHHSTIINEHELIPTISIGFTFIDEGTLPLKDYIKQADNAMYQAKKAGRNTYRVFNIDMELMYDKTMKLRQAFMGALDNNELVLYFQPKMCAHTMHVVGIEALIRWPFENELLLPQRILPIVEHLGVMESFTEWVTLAACQQLSQWLPAFPTLVVAINITACQLNANIVNMIKKHLSNNQIPPQNFEVEITESHLMESPEVAIPILEELHLLGVKIAVDDFGTGFSSLSYLAQLPIDTLKIDMSFVQGIETNSRNRNIVKAIVELAKSLELGVVAEGIENIVQQKMLCDLGTHELQGFLFAKPMDSEQCYHFLMSNYV